MSDRKSTDKLKIIFLEAAHQAGQSATRENLEAQKDFFRRIGLNPVLKSRKLSYSYHLPWSILADRDKISGWWSIWNKLRTWFQENSMKI